MGIYDWSITAADNGSADGTINFAENQAPSTLNDSARLLMARIAALLDWIGGTATHGGSANAYTLTSPSGHALSAYAAGVLVTIKPAATNTGASTLAVDGLAAVAIKTTDGDDVTAGELASGGLYLLIHDGTVFRIVGGGGSYQPLDATLTAWGALSGAANQMAYWTGSDTFALTSLTAFARTILDDVDAATARTTLGAQPLDATLTAFAGLTVSADQMVYATGSDAFAVTGLTSFARTILDDADAATVRATIGLGSAAIVATGTSGATIPLLNGANTWSADQALDGANLRLGAANIVGLSAAATYIVAANPAASILSGGYLQLWGSASANPGLVILGNASQTLALNGTTFTYNGHTVWHAGADGAGSGLDADTLDGVQGSSFAQLSGATFTGPVTARVNASSETSGTLTAASANRTIALAGDITVPNGVFSAGDMIVLYAGGAARTINQGSGLTLRLGGSASAGNRTMSAYGLSTLYFVSSSEAVISGNVA